MVESLLYNCKSQKSWQLDLEENKPALNLLDGLSKASDFKDILTYEAYGDAIGILLRDHILQTKPNYNEGDFIKFLSDLQDLLQKMVTEHWVIVPLQNATLKSTVRMRDFVFLAGTREDKISMLARLGKVSIAKAKSRASHTEASRSDGFFDHPLVAIRVDHQTDFVYRQARLYALWSIAILQVIYWGYEYEDKQKHRFLSAETQGKKVNHLAIWAKSDEAFRHKPLNFTGDCNFDISWIAKRVNQKKFRDLFQQIVLERDKNKLRFRFFKALRLFAKAIDSERNSGAFEGMGISVLYLTTTAEAILLDNDNEKRLRLTVLLPRLANLKGRSLVDCGQAIESAYRWRNSFVHSGEDTFQDWNDNFEPGNKATKVLLLKRMLAKLLADAPNHLNESTRDENADVNNLWNNRLKKEWEKALGLVERE